MPKIGLISLGCAKNLVDSEHMLALLRAAGWEITEDMAEADVGVVNTCGFIEAAKSEAIETILETAQYKQTGKMKGLVVTGCLVQRYAEEMQKELPEIDAICGTGSYENIVDAANAALGGHKAAYMADMAAAALDGDYAAEAIFGLYAKGILTGSDGDLTFRPNDSLTRAEAAAIVTRMARAEQRISLW